MNTAKLSGGLYTVKWEAIASDGDKTDGQWQFSVGAQAQAVPSVSITTPTMDAKFDKLPSDVTVSIKFSNFTLGQNNQHWQVFMDDELKLVAAVKDNSTTTTLKNVGQGEHLIKVVLLSGSNVVATDSTHVQVGAEAAEKSPGTMPKTGADNTGDLGWAALLAVEGVALLVIARLLRRVMA